MELTDEQRGRLIRYLRTGHTKYEASELVGITNAALHAMLQADNSLLAEVEAALDEASGPVLKRLRAIAMHSSDEKAAISAGRAYLEHVGPTPRAKREDVDASNRVASALERAIERAQNNRPAIERYDIIDAEEVED